MRETPDSSPQPADSASAETRTEPESPKHRTDASWEVSERYLVIEEAGRGGMASVLRAYDPILQREVALKRLHGQITPSTGDTSHLANRRLVAEARAMARLAHPNVVSVFDVEQLPSGRAGHGIRRGPDASGLARRQ